ERTCMRDAAPACADEGGPLVVVREAGDDDVVANGCPHAAVLAPRRGGAASPLPVVRYGARIAVRWGRDLVVVPAVPGHAAVGVDDDVLVLHGRARGQARDVEPRRIVRVDEPADRARRRRAPVAEL